MDLRYAGKCWVCNTALPAGTRAFYDPADKSVTCTAIECAEHAGLTKNEWVGSPVSGQWVRTLSEHRIGGSRRFVDATTAPFAKTRSQGYYGRDAGRCEDAPCCGCCS